MALHVYVCSAHGALQNIQQIIADAGISNTLLHTEGQVLATYIPNVRMY